LIYTFITIFVNIEDILSRGNIGFPDVIQLEIWMHFQMLFFICIMFYTLSVLPGFLIGGFISFHLKKSKQNNKTN